MNKRDAGNLFYQQAILKPGAWVHHCMHAAQAAEILAEALGLNENEAYSMGLLHDIGRSLTDGQFQHIACGYEFMMKQNEPEIARICLSHSFPVQDIHSYAGRIDVSKEEEQFYADLLSSLRYDAYDRLIQLVDAISVPDGYIPLEQRQKKLAEKYGPNPFAKDKLTVLQAYYVEVSQRLHQDILQYLLSRN